MDLSKMYEDHVGRVYGFFSFRLSVTADAEDLTAATFERAVRHAGRYSSQRASQATWLMAIAQNVLIDHFRRVGRHAEDLTEGALLDELPAVDRGREPTLGLDPELELALARLGDRERQVVALRFGGDLKGREIASITGLSEANVHQILSRSLRQLRQLLPS